MFAIGNCDRWFLSGRVPSAEIAYYGLAAKLALITAVVYQPFLLWWSARRLTILWEENGPAKLARAWGQGIGVLAISALIVALAAPSFVHAVFPDSYRRAIDYLPLLVLISVLNELCSLSNTGVYATSHGFRVLTVNGAGAAAAIAGYGLLIPSQGVMGAIEATMLAHLVRLALFLWLGREIAPVPYPWGRAAVAACFVMGAVVLAPPASALLLRSFWLAGSGFLLGMALIAMSLVSLPPFLARRVPRFADRLLSEG
jgi:O-antigen/teichoic acid export membrane protein